MTSLHLSSKKEDSNKTNLLYKIIYESEQIKITSHVCFLIFAFEDKKTAQTKLFEQFEIIDCFQAKSRLFRFEMAFHNNSCQL